MFGGTDKKYAFAQIASVAADAGVALPFTRPVRVTGVKCVSYAGVAASDSNYVQVSVTNLKADGTGTDVVAELDTRAAHENGLAAKVAKAANVDSAKVKTDENAVLYVLANQTGTTAGDLTVVVEYVTL